MKGAVYKGISHSVFVIKRTITNFVHMNPQVEFEHGFENEIQHVNMCLQYVEISHTYSNLCN